MSILRRASIPVLLLALGASSPMALQAQAFEVGTNAVNAGVGLGGFRYNYLSAIRNDVTISPTLCASFERGVSELGPGVLGLGAFVARKSVKYESVTDNAWSSYVYRYDQRWSNTVIGLRGSWHYNEWHGLDQLDLYAGIMLGYNIGSFKDASTRTRRSDGTTEPWNNARTSNLSFATYSTYLGVRYFFTEAVGAYMEFGYGISYMNLGAAVKF